MSKTLGYILLVGLVGSVLVSIGLLMWVTIRSNNPNDANKNATPTASPHAELFQNTIAIYEADAPRLVQSKPAGWWLNLENFANGGLTSNFDDAELACA